MSDQKGLGDCLLMSVENEFFGYAKILTPTEGESNNSINSHKLVSLGKRTLVLEVGRVYQYQLDIKNQRRNICGYSKETLIGTTTIDGLFIKDSKPFLHIAQVGDGASPGFSEKSVHYQYIEGEKGPLSVGFLKLTTPDCCDRKNQV